MVIQRNYSQACPKEWSTSRCKHPCFFFLQQFLKLLILKVVSSSILFSRTAMILLPPQLSFIKQTKINILHAFFYRNGSFECLSYLPAFVSDFGQFLQLLLSKLPHIQDLINVKDINYLNVFELPQNLLCYPCSLIVKLTFD